MHALILANPMLFLSTLSLRRATPILGKINTSGSISIHALLAESDLGRAEAALLTLNFYPRSPCGERPRNQTKKQGARNFYPRSPCGERLIRIDEF